MTNELPLYLKHFSNSLIRLIIDKRTLESDISFQYQIYSLPDSNLTNYHYMNTLILITNSNRAQSAQCFKATDWKNGF